MPQDQKTTSKVPASPIKRTAIDIIMPTTGSIMRCGKCHNFDYSIYVKPHITTAKIVMLRCKNCGHSLSVDDGVPIATQQSWDRRTKS